MIHLVDEAIEALLLEEIPGLGDATVVFDAPSDDDDGLHLRVRLLGIALSNRGKGAGTEHFERDGVRMQRAIRPSVELTYALTTGGSPSRDAHQLLGAALIALLRTTTVPESCLPEALVETDAPITLRVPRDGEADLDLALLPAAIVFRASVPVDLTPGSPVADAPGTIDFGVTDEESGKTARRRRYAGTVADPAAVGASVVGPSGAGTVDEQGRFVIVAEPGDTVTVLIEPPRTATVPDTGRIVVD